MNWADLEKSFHRALFLSFSKKKWALVFPTLVFCGILIVFCRAVAFEAGPWLAMSFAFLPIFLSSGVLLALGALLTRMHRSESKHLTFSVKQLLMTSSNLLIGTFYLSVPSLLVYFCLWILLGLFFLLAEIPFIGAFFSVVLSFGPFLLLTGSLFLCVFNLGLLFFVAPAASFQSPSNLTLAKQVLVVLKERLLSGLALFFIGLFPIAALAALLSYAAILTNLSFSIAKHSLSIALEWFFIMLPFCALLTPAVVFFFNFAAESYQLLRSSNTEVKTKIENLKRIVK